MYAKAYLKKHPVSATNLFVGGLEHPPLFVFRDLRLGLLLERLLRRVFRSSCGPKGVVDVRSALVQLRHRAWGDVIRLTWGALDLNGVMSG